MENWENDLINALGKEAEKDKAVQNLSNKLAKMRTKLEKVADILADHNVIINTPGAKRAWVESE